MDSPPICEDNSGNRQDPEFSKQPPGTIPKPLCGRDVTDTEGGASLRLPELCADAAEGRSYIAAATSSPPIVVGLAPQKRRATNSCHSSPSGTTGPRSPCRGFRARPLCPPSGGHSAAHAPTGPPSGAEFSAQHGGQREPASRRPTALLIGRYKLGGPDWLGPPSDC